MNIQGIGGSQQIAEMLMEQRMSAPAGSGQSSPVAAGQLASVTNDQGQSLIDIRDDLKNAVQDALANFDGEGDLRATVQDAFRSTLEENGFDPAQVRGAMEGSGFSPLSAMSNGGDEEDLVQMFLQQFRAGSHLDLAA